MKSSSFSETRAQHKETRAFRLRTGFFPPSSRDRSEPGRQELIDLLIAIAMEDVKWWNVTYTKHLIQKRKVYQDGFLELRSSDNKAKLYDDCEKLLECKVLKKVETVESGESLTFSAYLVDVGDPAGDSKPITTNLNFSQRKKVGIHSDRKPKTEQRKSLKTLSPSQKVIREFKKRELSKYGTPMSFLETAKPSVKEWQVLYTKQVTSKAKKLHEGFLQLEICGSFGRQVMLFDASRKLLDTKFFKRDDIIRSGESVSFGAYLVQIGDCEGDHMPDINVQANNCKGVEIAEKMHGQQDCEWQVLYTTELNKKSKKYHDGFLQLKMSGSQGRQIVLYDSSKNTLESKFLNRDEIIRSGDSITLDAHLIDIGELEGNHGPQLNANIQEIGNRCAWKRGTKHEKHDCLGRDVSVTKECPPNKSCFVTDMGLKSQVSSLHKITSSRRAPPNKPLRNVNQILSVLQEQPMVPESHLRGYADKLTIRLPAYLTDHTILFIGFSSGGQTTASLALHYGLNEMPDEIKSTEKMDNKKLPDDFSSKDLSAIRSWGGSGAELPHNREVEKSIQHFPDIESGTNTLEGGFTFGKSSAIPCSSPCGPTMEGKSAEALKNAIGKDECPSFDLEF